MRLLTGSVKTSMPRKRSFSEAEDNVEYNPDHDDEEIPLDIQLNARRETYCSITQSISPCEIQGYNIGGWAVSGFH